MPLPKIKYKNSINAASLQLASSVCAASTFDQVLVEPSELQFVSSPGLSHNQHNCQYACEVIAINKEFDIYPNIYHLNTLSPLVFIIKVVDKVACCYLRLLLAWADDFHKVQIEYEIARLDIIAVQAANWASSLKNAFKRI